MKSRGGRPPLPDGQAKHYQYKLRLSFDDADAVCREAIRRGVSVAEVIREGLRVLGVLKSRDQVA